MFENWHVSIVIHLKLQSNNNTYQDKKWAIGQAVI